MLKIHRPEVVWKPLTKNGLTLYQVIEESLRPRHHQTYVVAARSPQHAIEIVRRETGGAHMCYLAVLQNVFQPSEWFDEEAIPCTPL